MKLITKEIEALFKKYGRQEGNPDPIVLAHFFNPCGPGNWWATGMSYLIKKGGQNGERKIIEVEASEMNEEISGIVVDINFYGFVSVHGDFCDEWGHFKLSDFSQSSVLFGEYERSLYPKPISKDCQQSEVITLPNHLHNLSKECLSK
jgi:hypothetical protein